MDALSQTEIVDERKSRLERTGVESIGMLSVTAGLTASSWTQDFNLIGRSTNRQIRHGDIFREVPPADSILRFFRLPAQPIARPFRHRELEWRRTHMKTLKEFENKWVVLEGEDIVAHGSDPVMVIREAKEKGVRKPYIFFVETKNENVISMGL